jgi:hypothetical protein
MKLEHITPKTFVAECVEAERGSSVFKKLIRVGNDRCVEVS